MTQHMVITAEFFEIEIREYSEKIDGMIDDCDFIITIPNHVSEYYHNPENWENRKFYFINKGYEDTYYFNFASVVSQNEFFTTIIIQHS
jgi:hypothetical protein